MVRPSYDSGADLPIGRGTDHCPPGGGFLFLLTATSCGDDIGHSTSTIQRRRPGIGRIRAGEGRFCIRFCIYIEVVCIYIIYIYNISAFHTLDRLSPHVHSVTCRCALSRFSREANDLLDTYIAAQLQGKMEGAEGGTGAPAWATRT